MGNAATSLIIVPDGPHKGAWFETPRKRQESPLDQTHWFHPRPLLRDYEALPIEVSRSPEHWALLLALVIVDQARVVIL